MRDSGQSATLTARQLGASFPPDPEAQIDQRSLELLLQPIKYLDGMVSSDLNGAGQSFCAAFNQATLHKFPFDPHGDGRSEARRTGRAAAAEIRQAVGVITNAV